MSLGEHRVQSGLIGLWHLNGNSTDSSGSGNNGSDTSVAYSQANGKLGQGISLAGNGHYVTLGSYTNMNFGAGNFTIAILFKTSLSTYGTSFCIDNANLASPRKIIRLDHRADGKVDFLLYDNSTYYATTSSKVVNDDKWHLFIGVRDGDNGYLYLDGSLSGSRTGLNGITFTTSAGTVLFGKDYSNDGPYTGSMDEIALFNVAKTANWARQQWGLVRFGQI